MKIYAVLFMFAGIISCTHAPLLSEENRGDLLFPYGTYHHNVNVEILSPTGGPLFQFTGIVQTQKNQIKLVALSGMGSTLFRITEKDSDRLPDEIVPGSVEIENYIYQIKKYQPQILNYYSLVREILRAPKDLRDTDKVSVEKRNAQEQPVQFHVKTNEAEADVQLSQYESSGIPRRFEVNNTGFRIQVEVTDYAK